MSTDLPFLPLRTERMILRVQRLEDAERLSDLSNDLDVVRHLARVPYPNPPERVREYIASGLENLAAGCEVPFAITSAASGEVTGPLSLRMVGMGVDAIEREAELGYWLGQVLIGAKGFMTEAVQRRRRLRMFGPVPPMKTVWAAAFMLVSLRKTPRPCTSYAKAGLGGNASRRKGMVLTPARDDDEAIESIFLERLAPRHASASRRRRPHRPGRPRAVWPSARQGRVSGRACGNSPAARSIQGETPEAALIRELKEELDVDTAESCLAPFTFASHSYEDFHLLMPLYVCRVWQGNPTPMEGQNLAWVRPLQMKDYPMPPADKPLVAMLRDLL